MNRKSLESKIAKLYGNARVDVYKGHMMDGRFGWIMREFGKNEQYLGKNLRDAHEVIDNKLDS